MKFFIEDFFSECFQIIRFLRIWSYLLKKSLLENFIFCALKITQISEKGYDLLVSIMYFIGSDYYQNFLFFVPMLSSLILDSNKKVTNWILTRTLSENIIRFDSNLGSTMSNLDTGKLILKFNNSVLVQIKFLSLYSNFITFFYHFTNNFTPKTLVQSD